MAMRRRLESGRAALLALGPSVLCVLLAASPARGQRACIGDCDAGGEVAINELVTGVSIALGGQQLNVCPAFDRGGSGAVEIDEIIAAVNNALAGCQPCPLARGKYTITQASFCSGGPNDAGVCSHDRNCSGGRCVCLDLRCRTAHCEGGDNEGQSCDHNADCPDGTCAGGNLTVSALSTFDFPTGGRIVQDVGTGNANCVHDVVIPFPGGFSAPVFCIPGLGFTVEVVQTACGIGQLDSDGGADYTVTEIGDTSDSSSTCDLPDPGDCADGGDSAVRIDITVGDGTADTCTSGTANVIVAVPVRTTTWIEHNSGEHCGLEPGADGTFDPGLDPVTDDTLVVEFPQILDFTTARTTSRWSDLDGDGCLIAGRGPAAGFTMEGGCLDLDRMTLSTVASGPIGSSGQPLYDLTYATFLPNTFSGPEPLMGATCETPPTIDFTGLAHRCISTSE